MGFAAAMSMLDDDMWEAMMEELGEDYNQDAIDQFNEYRDRLKAEMARKDKEQAELKQALAKRDEQLEAMQAQGGSQLQQSFIGRR